MPRSSLSSYTTKAGGLPGNSQGNQQERETKVALALLGRDTALQARLQELFQLYLGWVFPLTNPSVVSFGTIICVSTWIFLMLFPFWDVPNPYGLLGEVCLVQETSKSQGQPVEKEVFGSLFPAGWEWLVAELL